MSGAGDRPGPRDLVQLRDDIARVDRALSELLRRRFELAEEVGRFKAEADAPIVVKEVEDRVLARARGEAESCGVSPSVMEAIFGAIVHGSVERQHRVGIARREKAGWNVLLIGGAGGMGSWFRHFFGLGGHAVDVIDAAFAGLPSSPGSFGSLAEVGDVDGYDAILVSVPLAATPEVLEELVARRPRGVVVEITSIKDHCAPAMARLEEAGVRLLAVHPMFGPSKSPYQPLTFVHAVRRDLAEERQVLERLLAHPYTELVSVDFHEHDRLMAWLLGLSHLTNLVFGDAMLKAEVDADLLHRAASTTFLRQARTALSVLGDNPDLYLDIQRLNPHRGRVFAALRDATDHLERCVAQQDREGFRATLAGARRILDR
jgi:chorismate mutase/prephenate dehydrogenase